MKVILRGPLNSPSFLVCRENWTVAFRCLQNRREETADNSSLSALSRSPLIQFALGFLIAMHLVTHSYNCSQNFLNQDFRSRFLLSFMLLRKHSSGIGNSRMRKVHVALSTESSLPHCVETA